MFKDDYKKHYDSIHPSEQLMEKTKKLAIQQSMDRVLQEEIPEEDLFDIEETRPGKRKQIGWIKVVGGMAAGIAVILTGTYVANSLKSVENETMPSGQYAVATIEATMEAEEKEEKDVQVVKEQPDRYSDEKKITVNADSNRVKQLANYAKDTVYLDYASESTVIMHSNFGILAYDCGSRSIVAYIEKDHYYSPENWKAEQIFVNEEGNKIFWKNPTGEKEEAKEYDLNTKKISVLESTDWAEKIFTGVVGVAGTAADVYAASCNQMVQVADGRFCQLIYEAPDSGKQASLAVAMYNVNTKEDTVYSIFQNIGWAVIQEEGSCQSGSYLEVSKPDWIYKVSPTIEVTETQAPMESQIPVETDCPEQTELPVESTESVDQTEDTEVMVVSETEKVEEKVIKTPIPVDEKAEQESTQ